jgi:hypothetical protein
MVLFLSFVCYVQATNDDIDTTSRLKITWDTMGDLFLASGSASRWWTAEAQKKSPAVGLIPPPLSCVFPETG